MKEEVYLTLVFPVFNGALFIENSIREIVEYYSNKDYFTEIILIEDGSNDDTSKILKKHNGYETDKLRIKIIYNGINKGKGYSVRTGMLKANGKYRIFTDCDLAYSLSEVDKVLHALENGCDVAIACRRHEDSICETKPAVFKWLYYRELQGMAFNYILRFLGITKLDDTQAGLKGITQKAIPIFEKQKTEGFSFDVEILYLAEIMSLKVERVAVRYKFFNDDSTINNIMQSFDMLKTVRKIKKLHGRK